MKIFLGTCGWAYREWVGIFYPEGTRPSINYYTNFFNALEIDSTYYSIPPKETFENSIRKIHKDIKVSIKIPSSVSHFGEINDRKRNMDQFIRNVMDPAKKRDEDSKFLFTLPPWISNHNLEDYLVSMAEITFNESNIYCEPRIFDENNFQQIQKLIENAGFRIAFTDNYINHLRLNTTKSRKAYIRLHGRNQAFTVKESGMEKFLYDYNMNEMATIKDEILKYEGQFNEIFIFFNNHPSGNAPLNAMELGNMLGVNKMSRLL
ncbi:DUF72 domain-containing protein [Cuniculiplasma divulgatum]|uniref:TIM beta/alpha-barrel protein n=1 Tax=Cuniculiplasma divulgatum TaxID=1673428 RepID=A0A1R4A954_9ARCH|nr:DUF72 domain-containing protein [Cuniculiplasma divulgatum]MCI2413309.1 DUF72 domain-containing protein [Cuniculiplasma sp.]SJK85497.1 TIM beta/alpha-barrel protein [Cuniculiplasma divulgatum]